MKRKGIKVSRIEEKVKEFNELNTVNCYGVKKLSSDCRAANIYCIRRHARGKEECWGKEVFEGTELQVIAYLMGMIEGWRETLNRHER